MSWRGKRGCRVRFDAGPDGTGSISGHDLPVAEVAGARAFIKDLAKTLRGDGDACTLEQLVADIFLDLLQGRHLDVRGAQPKVELVAPLETWLRLGSEAAELTGFGAISADVMEEIRAAAATAGATAAGGGAECTWSATRDGIGIRHGRGGVECARPLPHDGVAMRHGRGRYEPSRAQRAFIRAMLRTCSHPGCVRAAEVCDLDHLTEYRLGGPTCG